MNISTKVIDLTHTLSEDIPTWDGSCGFTLAIETDYEDCAPPNLFRTQELKLRAGTGTHMDAPAHCFKGGATIDELSLENLVTECVVIKIPNADEGYCIMPDVVRDFENTHGRIPEHAFVIFATGWSARWAQPEMYRNNLQFPSVHETTAQLLLERNISGLGTDTLSADTGKNGFPVHQAILGAGKYLVENIAHAEALPETGSRVAVLPLKIKEGTESPVRLIGLL